jgi:hypothetical protein
MTQCGRLFTELEGMKLEGILVKTKDKLDFNFSKAIIDFKRHLVLGSNTIIHDNIECELIPIYNINRISLVREGGGHIHIDRMPEEESEEEEETLHD